MAARDEVSEAVGGGPSPTPQPSSPEPQRSPEPVASCDCSPLPRASAATSPATTDVKEEVKEETEPEGDVPSPSVANVAQPVEHTSVEEAQGLSPEEHTLAFPDLHPELQADARAIFTAESDIASSEAVVIPVEIDGHGVEEILQGGWRFLQDLTAGASGFYLSAGVSGAASARHCG